MSVIGAFVEGIKTLAEGPSPQRVVRPITEAPSTARPMSLVDELELPEKKAREKGMSYNELNETRQIGDCPAQIQTRVTRLHQWLAVH